MAMIVNIISTFAMYLNILKTVFNLGKGLLQGLMLNCAILLYNKLPKLNVIDMSTSVEYKHHILSGMAIQREKQC